MRTDRILIVLFGLLAGCAPQGRPLAGNATPPVRDDAAFRPWITPEQAVMEAAAAQDGVTGTFRLIVRGSGRQGGNLYLNSERDYRDPRSISIDIPDALAATLSTSVGRPIESHLAGRTILVRGTARKTRIDFLFGGRRTGKYYYQTHVQVGSPEQLIVLSEASEVR